MGRKKYQQLQGTYPVISLSFANVKERDYTSARKKICQLLTKLYAQYSFLLGSGILYKTDVDFLDTGKYGTYWANTSANSLVDRLIRQGDKKIKENFEKLLNGESILCPVDEQIMYDQLNGSEKAIWSLLLAGGYLKVIFHENYDEVENGEQLKYELAITNHEVKLMFHNMVRDWFSETGADYSDFVDALLLGDIDAMNEYMNRISEQVFSTFDVGRNPSRSQPERFYHGFVLGLITELMGKYEITSNRESGFGRYDVVIESKKKEQAIIIEFKVFNQKKEKTLKDTLQAAHNQIDEKKYDTALLAKGFTGDQIHKYGFAFEGKKILIG